MDTPRKRITAVKDALRNPYGWPGGYRRAIYTEDGEELCMRCTRENFRLIVQATVYDKRYSNPWAVAEVNFHWEGPPHFCCNCNVELPSEYGGLDEEA